MSHYIYLNLRHAFAQELNSFWEKLKQTVMTGQITDLASLQYPPHVTICGSFEMEKQALDLLIADVKKVFDEPFHSNIDTQRVLMSFQIHSFEFIWQALSRRIFLLKQMYPLLPWVTSGYHLTLIHGPLIDDVKVREEVMRRTATVLPIFPVLEKDFSVIIWSYEKVPTAKYSWETRKWTILSEIKIKSY